MTQPNPLRVLQQRRQEPPQSYKRYATLTNKQRADRDRAAARAVRFEAADAARAKEKTA